MARQRLAFVALIAMLSACVSLDTQGRILCGDGGMCPSGFECRWGRCCPSGSSTSECPLGLNDSFGLTYLPSGTVCPAGFIYTGSVNRCCPVRDTSPCSASRVGNPCTDRRECDDTPSAGCIKMTDTGMQFPDSYCFRLCSNDGDCGANAVCLQAVHICAPLCTLQTSERFAPCRVPADGRSKYVCVKLRDLNPSVTDGRAICVPDCTVPGYQCGDNFECDPTMHACVPRS